MWQIPFWQRQSGQALQSATTYEWSQSFYNTDWEEELRRPSAKNSNLPASASNEKRQAKGTIYISGEV